LGVLIGGDTGRKLVAGADEFFRVRGAINPEQLVASLIPGCEID
jgi:hypothetical protein